MEVGISSIIFERKMRLYEGLLCLKQEGYSCVDFSVCDFSLPTTPAEDSFLAEDWKGKTERLSAYLSDIGLRCNQAHATWGQTTDLRSFCPPAPLLYRQIDIAKELGADTLVFHPVLPKKRVESMAERQRYIDYTVEWFKPLAEYAAKREAGIAVENVFADRGNEPQEGLYPFGDAESLAEVADRISYEKMGICLDTGHANLHVGRDIGKMIDILGHRIRCLHFNENLGRQRGIPCSDLHMVPGGMGLDLYEIAKHLCAVAYKGVISLEVVDRTPNTAFMKEQLRYAKGVASRFAELMIKEMCAV